MDKSRNPYVGSKPFEENDKDYFFGREREWRDLLARVISRRVVVFYAQSGAGKSSLINARLLPGLRRTGFASLNVGRVSGELADCVESVDNIFVISGYNTYYISKKGYNTLIISQKKDIIRSLYLKKRI